MQGFIGHALLFDVFEIIHFKVSCEPLSALMTSSCRALTQPILFLNFAFQTRLNDCSTSGMDYCSAIQLLSISDSSMGLGQTCSRPCMLSRTISLSFILYTSSFVGAFASPESLLMTLISSSSFDASLLMRTLTLSSLVFFCFWYLCAFLKSSSSLRSIKSFSLSWQQARSNAPTN